MKNQILKMTCLLTGLLVAVGCAKSEDSAKPAVPKKNESISETLETTADPVTLISRYTGGDYVTATYIFRHLTRDNLELTRNNWEILFEAREDFDDRFEVNTVVDDNSYIYDLGRKSCEDIKSSYPQDRKDRPLTWLAYSDADPSELEPTRRVNVQQGHCYLAYNSDSDGRIISLFHVKSHEKSKSVTIDQIEVLDRLIRK